MHVLADEFEPRIAHKHTRQQTCLAQNLKAVADTEHEAAFGGKVAYGIHDRRARRNRAAAQVIAVGKSARHHHKIRARGQRCLGVPDHRGLVARSELQRAGHVALAIDSGKEENGGFHSKRTCFLPLSPKGEGKSNSTLQPGNSRSRCWPRACRRRLSTRLPPSPCRRRRARCRTPCPSEHWRRHRRRAISARLRWPCLADRECRTSA